MIGVGFGIFIYQTLDAIDGKHQRRTDNSSPAVALSEFFDHGCDSISNCNYHKPKLVSVLKISSCFYRYFSGAVCGWSLCNGVRSPKHLLAAAL